MLSAWTVRSHQYLWAKAFRAAPKKHAGDGKRGRIGKNYGEDLACRKLSTLDNDDFVRVLEGIAKSGVVPTANRARSLAMAVQAFGRKRKLWKRPKLSDDMAPFATPERVRPIHDVEIGALMAALEGEDQRLNDFVRLDAALGLRRSNLEGMRWKWIDLDRGELTVPASQFKTRIDFTLPLTEGAAAILAARRGSVIGEYVFPGTRPGTHWKCGHAVWKRLCRKAGIEGLRVHDLRHLFGQSLSRAGYSQAMIQRCMGHASLAASGRYQSMRLSDANDAMNRVADTIAKISERQGADVVGIKEGRRSA